MLLGSWIRWCSLFSSASSHFQNLYTLKIGIPSEHRFLPTHKQERNYKTLKKLISCFHLFSLICFVFTNSLTLSLSFSIIVICGGFVLSWYILMYMSTVVRTQKVFQHSNNPFRSLGPSLYVHYCTISTSLYNVHILAYTNIFRLIIECVLGHYLLLSSCCIVDALFILVWNQWIA